MECVYNCAIEPFFAPLNCVHVFDTKIWRLSKSIDLSHMKWTMICSRRITVQLGNFKILTRSQGLMAQVRYFRFAKNSASSSQLHPRSLPSAFSCDWLREVTWSQLPPGLRRPKMFLILKSSITGETPCLSLALLSIIDDHSIKHI